MTRSLRFARVLFAALLLTSCGKSEGPPRLRVEGRNVLDPAGRPILLRGYNWGQWVTWEPEDGVDNAAEGANCVRIPLRWWGDYGPGIDSRMDGAPGHIAPAHLEELDATIRRATSAGLWVVLFLDSDNGQGQNPNSTTFWNDADAKAKFIEAWELLARRYLHEPGMAAYEILPEPDGPSGDDVRAFYESVIPHIRAIDRRIPLIVGPDQMYNLRELESAYTPVDDQIIYTGNYFIFDIPLSRIPDIIAFREAHDAPVWINQVGIETGKDDALAKARTVLTAFREENVGFAWWTYRIRGSDPGTHGIFYRDEADTTWLEKPEWRALLAEFLP